MTDTPGGYISDTPRECLGQWVREKREEEEKRREEKRETKSPIAEPVC